MGATIDDVALDIGNGSKKNVSVMPDGKVLLVIPKTSTTFRVYESTDRLTYTLKLTLTVTALPAAPSIKYTTAVDPTGTKIMLTYVCNDGSIRSRLITYAGYTAAAEQTAYPATANIGARILDTDWTPGGGLVLAFPYSGPAGDKNGYIIRFRDTTGAWTNLEKVTLDGTGSQRSSNTDVSVACYKSAAAASRRFDVFVQYGNTTGDKGIRWVHCSINETNGASFSRQTASTWITTGLLNYDSTTAAFGSIPKRVLAVGMNATVLTVAISSLSNAYPNGLQYNSCFAGAATITTLGANAAADVVAINILQGATTDSTANLAYGGKVITFAYDNNLDPTFNFVDSARPLQRYVFGQTPVQVVESRVITVYNSLIGLPVLITKEGGQWDNNAQQRQGMSGYTSADYLNKRHDMSLQYTGSSKFSVSQAPIPSVTAVRPAAGEVSTSSKPIVGATAVIKPWTYKPPSFVNEYQIASDAGFTTGLYNFTSQTRRLYNPYDLTIPANRFMTYTEQWAGLPVPEGTAKYARTRILDPYGNYSAYFTTPTTFSILHPGLSKSVTPTFSATDPQAFAYSDPGALGYSLHYVSWGFSDAWVDDFQTAYQIILKSSLGVTIYDSGKVVSSNKNAMIRVPFANKNDNLTYTVQVWDSFDYSGGIVNSDQQGSLLVYSGPALTALAATTVDGGGNINSAAPTFSYAITDGLYDTVSLDVLITQGSEVIGSVTIANPGAAGTVTFSSILDNNEDYTITGIARDSNGLAGNRILQGHTTWTPPAAPTGVTIDLTNYNVENSSSLDLHWSNAAKDADWIGWNVYRQIDQIDPNTGAVVQLGTLTLLTENVDDVATITFNDYTAPSGVRVSYVVRQVVNRFGSIIESINTALTSAFPVTEGYWLIDPTPEDPNFASFHLYNVTADSFTHKYESQVTHIIGRGNHEDRGDDLGVDGSLVVQFRDGQSSTARQKKLRLESMKDEVRSLFLRNPFGDLWFVSIGDIQFDRIAGVGRSEFVDATLSYTEVYE